MIKTVYLGGGCFWCTEAIFKSLKGVLAVLPGYMGGSVPNPTYEQVCTGSTGHAEVIKVEFDPLLLPLADLLDVFFETHDPTTPDRQGADTGTQYRSIVFYTDDDDREAVAQVIARAQEKHADKIVTEIAEAREFYPAEEYHYDYYAQHASVPYCQVVISPKLEKLQQKFGNKIK
jgi:peptide-methionine (S)-S-oxide reductase